MGKAAVVLGKDGAVGNAAAVLGKNGAVSINKLRRHLQIFHQLKLKQMPDVLPRERHFIFYELGISTRAYNFSKQSILRALGEAHEDAKKAKNDGNYNDALFIFLRGIKCLKDYPPAMYDLTALKFYFAAKDFLNSKKGTSDPKYAESAILYSNEWYQLYMSWHEIKLVYDFNSRNGSKSIEELAAVAGYWGILKKAVGI